MQVKVSVRHGHIASEAEGFLREKAEKLLHLFDRITQIEVTVDMAHANDKIVEILVDAEHKHDFVAKDHDAELYAAFDKALDRIKHQLHKYKEKVQDHRRDPHTGDGPGGRV